MVTFDGYDVELSRGDTLVLKITLDGRDLPEGTDGVFTIKKRIKSDEVVLQKRFNASDEVLTVVLDADETNIDPGTYYWDVRLQIPLEEGGYEVYTPMEYAAFVVLPVVGTDIGADGSNMVNPDLPVLQVVLAEMRQAIQDANDAAERANEAVENVESGADGVGIASVEQTVTSTEDGGMNEVTVTKTDGTTSTFEVRNGSKGSQGEKGDTGAQGEKGDTGAAGYTPVRGTDYWTESDKQEIVEETAASITPASIGAAALDSNGKVAASQATSAYSYETVTSKTLTEADNGKVIAISNSSAITVTIPTGLPALFEVEIIQWGTGQITFVGDGTTLCSLDGALSTAGKYAVVSVKKLSSTGHLLSGALA